MRPDRERGHGHRAEAIAITGRLRSAKDREGRQASGPDVAVRAVDPIAHRDVGRTSGTTTSRERHRPDEPCVAAGPGNAELPQQREQRTVHDAGDQPEMITGRAGFSRR
ncbi:MAG: hypothetical protein U0838_07915 [Chloroflexota bacterium]